MDKVIFTGATDAQVNWGGNDDPRGLLVEGTEYDVFAREVHSWHTKLHLVGYQGKAFNSVCFDEMPNDQNQGDSGGIIAGGSAGTTG